MNAKTKTIIAIIIAVLLTLGLIGYVYANSITKDDTPTITEQCTISDTSWCETLIKTNSDEYIKNTERNIYLNKENNIYRAIQKLWTGTTETWDFQ